MSVYISCKAPESWSCPVCLGEDPSSTVAHEGGQNHPIHKKCAISALAYSSLCPSGCGAKIAPMPSISGVLFVPKNQAYIGIGLFFTGVTSRIRALTIIGLCLQVIGIERAISQGGQHIHVAHQIKKLIDEMGDDFTPSKLENLGAIASQYPYYYAQISKWVDSNDRKSVIEGLKSIREITQIAIQKDQYLRVWSSLATIGAVYTSLKGGKKSFSYYCFQRCKVMIAAAIKSLSEGGVDVVAFNALVTAALQDST